MSVFATNLSFKAAIPAFWGGFWLGSKIREQTDW
jgi:hypothetical protein